MYAQGSSSKASTSDIYGKIYYNQTKSVALHERKKKKNQII